MIETISIKNFKCHADTTITLGRVTALVGPNGCGKTSVLQPISYLSKMTNQVWHRLFVGPLSLANLLRFGSESFSIALSGCFQQTPWELSVTFAQTGDFQSWEPVVTWQWDGNPGSGQLKEGRDLAYMLPEGLANALGKAGYFKGIASQLSLPSSPLENPPKLAPDGSGLASVLANLMTLDRKRREQVEQALCAIVPTVKEVNARTVTLKRKEKKVFAVNGAQFPYEEEHDVPGSELIFNTVSGNGIPAQQMSDGTLLTLGLLTLLHSSAPDTRLFLLDDVEQGLHSLARRQLVKTLREFAEQHDKQILLTTHSGYIVDELEPEDVWVLQTDAQGISHAKRLSEHPDAKRLLDVLTTGELADAVGENWVLPQTAQAVAAGEAHA